MFYALIALFVCVNVSANVYNPTLVYHSHATPYNDTACTFDVVHRSVTCEDYVQPIGYLMRRANVDVNSAYIRSQLTYSNLQ
jgi:hypothetical protein